MSSPGQQAGLETQHWSCTQKEKTVLMEEATIPQFQARCCEVQCPLSSSVGVAARQRLERDEQNEKEGWL